MGQQLSSDGIKQEFIDLYPNNFGLLSYYLWYDIATLHQNWKNYRIFYGDKQSVIEVLNDSAPTFFSSLERIMRHEIILSIGRLTDPSFSDRKHKNENASLIRLVEGVIDALNNETKKEVEEDVKRLEVQASKIRNLRNKLIAHSDLQTKLELKPKPLAGISLEEVEEMLKSLRKIFNRIEQKFRGSKTNFDGVFSLDDAENIIGHLKNSKIYIEQRYLKYKE